MPSDKIKGILILALSSILMIRADEVALQEFTTGNNLFTAAIYKEILKENKENFLFSPFSIETVLALTQSGAKDETAAEIRQGLHLPDSDEKVKSVYTALLPTLKGNGEYALHTANKIYVKEHYPIQEDFKKVASSVYQADTENIDFTLKDKAAETMNKWVEQQTNNKIHNLIDPNKLGPDTRAVLINALYFKGKWQIPFDSDFTGKQDFYKSSDEVVQVDTMHVTDTYNYYESPELNAKFLELPYEGKDISMVIVLPNEKDGLAALENQLEKVFTTPNFVRERVAVSMPKFTIENKVPLKTILKNLGIQKAFNDEADLSGMAGKKGELVISDVLQKAFINVTETGTEAAAATAAIGVDRIGFFGVHTLQFNIDRPFVFYIALKDMVLFSGRITDPRIADKSD